MKTNRKEALESIREEEIAKVIARPIDEEGIKKLNDFLIHINTPPKRSEQVIKDILLILDSRGLISYKENNVINDEMFKVIPYNVNNAVENMSVNLCRQYGIKIEALEMKTRKTEVLKVRKAVYLMLYCTTKLSLAAIGSFFPQGGDHANVLHHLSAIKERIDVDRRYRIEISLLAREYNFLYQMIDKLEINIVWAIKNGMVYLQEAVDNGLINRLEMMEFKENVKELI